VAKIIAISNQKGGVAKTTSCISIGACLAEAGSKVLLIDLDPQVNLTISNGIDPEELDYTLADLLDPEGDVVIPPSEIIRSTALFGLDLLPSDQRLIEYELNARDMPGYEERLQKSLEILQTDYDYILIDCPPSMGSLTIMALTAANLALVPVQCEYYATRGLLSLIEIIKAVKKRTNPILEYAIFITMYDGRTLISRRIQEQLRESFSEAILSSVIGMDTHIRESAIANEPVLTYSPKTRASMQYRSLTEELVNRMRG